MGFSCVQAGVLPVARGAGDSRGFSHPPAPPSCSALCITSCNGDGRKYKPPPAAPSSIRAADSIESCRNGSPCPGSIQGNIHYPKTKTRGVHSWGPTLQIPLPPSLPLLLLLHTMCVAAIYTVSPPKHPQCPTLRHWDLQGWCCAGILKAEMIQGLDLHWQGTTCHCCQPRKGYTACGKSQQLE